MKHFLVASSDESVVDHEPIIVLARSEQEAIQRVQVSVYSKDKLFREGVYDLAVNMSFAERFHLASEQEQARFIETGTYGTELELVKSRVRAYFVERPEFGELYLQYMDTEKKSLISDEMFEFIASKQGPDEHGLVALDIEKIKVLS